MSFTGSVTLNSGATWTEPASGNGANNTYNFANNFVNNATTFTAAGTGIHTFSGAGMTLSGTTGTTIPSVAVTGTRTLSGTLTVSTALTGAGTLTMGGTGVLNIGGTSTITTLTATAVGNTVNYTGTGTSQAVKATTYANLIFSGAGTKTMATGTVVNGNLSIRPTGTATASIGALLTLNVGRLVLGGTTQVSGTWGGTTSGATYINTTYFAATTGKLNVTAGSATRLVVTLPSQTFTSGTGNSGTVIPQTAGTSFNLMLSAVDAANNIDTTFTGSKAVSYSGPGNAPAGDTPSYTTTATFVNGQATSLATTLTKAETTTVTATISGLTAVASSSLTVNAGAVSASKSTLGASPSSVTADGSTTSAITVTLNDAYGNPVSGKSVSLNHTAGAGTPTITTVVNTTDSSGHGSWTVKSTTAAADTFTAIDTGDTPNVTVTATSVVTFTAGALHHYAITFSATPAYQNDPFTTTITAKDINNNTVITNTTVVMSSATPSTMMYEDPADPGHYYYEGAGPSYRTRSLSGGVASLKMQSTATGIGVTITATDGSSPGPITGSSTIDFEVLVGAYRTWGAGGAARNWSGSTTWQTYDNVSGWQATATPPNNSTPTPITILAGDTVTVDSSILVNQVHIQGQVTVPNGVTLTVQTASTESTSIPGLEVYGTVTVASGGTLTIATGTYESTVQVFAGGVLDNTGTINSTTGTLDFEPGAPGGTYRHSYTSGGTIPTATWDPGAVCEIAGYTSSTGPSGLGQSFYDVVWNCTGQTADCSVDLSTATIDHNFTVSSTGTKALVLGGNVTVRSGGTLSIASGARLYCAGYSVSGAGDFDLPVGAYLGIGHASGIAASGASGNVQNTGTRHFSSGANYIYNGTTTPQSAGLGLPANVHTLTVANTAGSGVVSLDQSLGVNDTLTLTSGTLSIGGNTLTIENALSTASGTLTGGASSALVITDAGGTAAVTLPTVNSGLQNFTINRATGINLGASLSVSGTLTLTLGKITTGASTLILTTAGTVFGGGSSSYVAGTLKKGFGSTGSGQSFAFPIGDATSYTPVALANMAITTIGNLTASTTAADQTGGANGLNPIKSVNRYWTITADTLVVSSYDPTFTFVAGDVDSSADTGNFVIRKYNGSAWSATTTGTRTSSSTATTGLSSFSEFDIGEDLPVATPKTFSRQPNTSLKMLISDLMVDNTDFGGATPSFASVAASSDQGATVWSSGLWVFYLPNSAGTADTFSYTISGQGGGTVNGTVTVNLDSPGAGGASGSISLIGNVATVRMYGLPGVQYEVQRSTDLVGWITLTSTELTPLTPPITASSADGSISFTDTFSGTPPTSAYYRVVAY